MHICTWYVSCTYVRICTYCTYMHVFCMYQNICLWEIHTYTYIYVQYLHLQSYMQIDTYTYIYCNIRAYTYIYVYQYPYLQYIQIRAYTYNRYIYLQYMLIRSYTLEASTPRIRYVRIRTYTDIYIHIRTNTIYDETHVFLTNILGNTWKYVQYEHPKMNMYFWILNESVRILCVFCSILHVFKK